MAWAAPAFEPGFAGGVPVGLAYVTDDGFADVVAGTGPGAAPRVRTLDGATGAVLATTSATSARGWGRPEAG